MGQRAWGNCARLGETEQALFVRYFSTSLCLRDEDIVPFRYREDSSPMRVFSPASGADRDLLGTVVFLNSFSLKYLVYQDAIFWGSMI